MSAQEKITVTAVDTTGKSTFEPARFVAPTTSDDGIATYRCFSAAGVPIPDIPYSSTNIISGIANDEGAVFLQCDMPPRAKKPMHGTRSVDLGVILSGVLTLTLESGEEKELRYASFKSIPDD